MKNILYKVSAVLILAVGSCKQEPVGPMIQGIFGEVVVTEPLAKSRNNPNFATGDDVYFTAKFEKDAKWLLTLTGQTSGAKKTFSGISSEINASNSTWTGFADEVPSFRQENVSVMLTFPNDPKDTLRESLTIAQKADLKAQGVIVSDFANIKITGPDSPTGWPSDWPATVNTHISYGLPDGNNYLSMTGTPWQGAGSPYVDFVTIPAREADINYGEFFPLYADPAKVFFNLMIYGNNTPVWLRIVLFEEGGGSRLFDLYPNWTGWRLVSINYTDFIVDNDVLPRPNRINAVQFVLLSNQNPLPATGAALVRTAIDHVIFTHNKPYQP